MKFNLPAFRDLVCVSFVITDDYFSKASRDHDIISLISLCIDLFLQ